MTDGRFWSVPLYRWFWWQVVYWTKTPAMWVDESIHGLYVLCCGHECIQTHKEPETIGMGRPITQCTCTFIICMCKVGSLFSIPGSRPFPKWEVL